MSKKRHLVACCAVCFLVSIVSIAMGQVHPAGELLAKYEKALGPMSHVRCEGTIQTTAEGDFNFNSVPRLETCRFDMARDGERFSLSKKTVSHADGNANGLPSRQTRSRFVITDQKYGYDAYEGDPPIALGVGPRDATSVLFALGAIGEDAYLHGRCDDGDRTIAGVMREASSLVVRPQPEQIDGKATQVLEGTGKYGRYTLWLDMESCLPLRLTIHKEGKDLAGRALLSTPPPAPTPGWTYDLPLSAEKTRDITIDEVQIEKKGDLYVPVRARVTSVSVYANGQQTRRESTVTREKVDLNADFDALKLFELDVPEGTPVNFVDELRGRSGVRFEWRNGKIATKIDSITRDIIDETVPMVHLPISATAESAPRRIRSADSVPDLRSSVKSQGYSWFIWSACGVAAVVVFTIILRASKKRMSGNA